MHAMTPSRRIRFHEGFWWYGDPQGHDRIRICGRMAEFRWRVRPLCRWLGLTRRTFERLVLESLGIPAKPWLRRLRVVHAGHLLREGRRIKEVAEVLGFWHHSSFTREFTRLMGVNPAEFQLTENRRAAAFVAAKGTQG